MRFRTRILTAIVAVAGFAMTTPPTHGDEGMWLFNNVPKKLLKEKYGFEPTDAWLEHLQKSSVRFNSGGSGSFVSANGLVMTNHHVGADDLQKLSTKEKDYLKDGFHAKTPADELKCKALELNVLQSIKDVTAEVNAAVKDGLPAAQAFQARQAKIAEIEKANADEAKGVRADVVALFAGGAYHLYVYKQYTDIRLVFAPEKSIAFFGGDPDNFEFPRFDLDMCFFRVYENDKPIVCEHFLKWSAAGSAAEELIFVSGHPGRTNRQNTVAELKYLRDTGYPYLLQRFCLMCGMYMPADVVHLTTGEVARVVANHAEMGSRPTVEVVDTAAGRAPAGAVADLALPHLSEVRIRREPTLAFADLTIEAVDAMA